MAITATAQRPPAEFADPTEGGESDTARWLVGEAVGLPLIRQIVGEFCRRLAAEGVPLQRVLVSLRTLHPELATVGYLWQRGEPDVREVARGHDIFATPLYQNSPIRLIVEGEDEIRRRIDPTATEFEFSILADLQALGSTDYICLPLRFSHGRRNVISFATDRPGGFTDRQLDQARSMLPLLSLVLEVHAAHQLAETLLDTYLGHEAGRRVLNGSVKRGEGRPIAAALWYCDLSGFTQLAERLPAPDIIEMLDEFFTCMAEPVERRGGEILKFIGDAMLAIFPMADDLDRDRACLTALEAAREALAGFDKLNERRCELGRPALGVKIALHAGTVVFGNIGAPSRLDFTTIGPAVNMVTRLEGLAGRLGLRLLASERFASPCDSQMVSIGYHPLRGIALQQELFTVPEEAARVRISEASDG
jgi:adenylate cyclase